MSDGPPRPQLPPAEWIERFALALGQEPPDKESVKELLDLAAEAAHASQRIAAPIACYLAGRDGRPVEQLGELARAVTAEGASRPDRDQGES